MKTFKFIFSFAVALMAATVFTGCDDDDDDEKYEGLLAGFTVYEGAGSDVYASYYFSYDGEGRLTEVHRKDKIEERTLNLKYQKDDSVTIEFTIKENGQDSIKTGKSTLLLADGRISKHKKNWTEDYEYDSNGHFVKTIFYTNGEFFGSLKTTWQDDCIKETENSSWDEYTEIACDRFLAYVIYDLGEDLYFSGALPLFDGCWGTLPQYLPMHGYIRHTEVEYSYILNDRDKSKVDCIRIKNADDLEVMNTIQLEWK